MFDWPEQSQTSPTSRSVTSTVFAPVTLRVYGPLTGNGPSLATHLPDSGTVVSNSWPAVATSTLRPGAA